MGQGTIKIGEINSYKAQPAFLEPYKKGWELAVEQINAAGGINGAKLEVISRDDNATPGDAVRVAEELASRENVVLLTGSFLSHIGLAISDFAKQRKILFVAAEPLTDKIVWDNGHKYTYRLRASTYMQTSMLVADAAKLQKKRWALVFPNYEYGTSAVASFKALIKAAQPDVEFVTEQATPLGKIDAGAVAQAIADAKPDAIFNVTFAADLAKFVREGQTRGIFKDIPVFSVLSGEPEYLDPLKEETPVRLVCHRLSGGRDRDAGAQGVLRCLQGEIQRAAEARLGGRLLGDSDHRRGLEEGGRERYREARCRHGRTRGDDAVRQGRLPHPGQPVDHGRLRRAAGGQGWPWCDGRLALRARRQALAKRRRGQGPSAGELTFPSPPPLGGEGRGEGRQREDCNHAGLGEMPVGRRKWCSSKWPPLTLGRQVRRPLPSPPKWRGRGK